MCTSAICFDQTVQNWYLIRKSLSEHVKTDCDARRTFCPCSVQSSCIIWCSIRSVTFRGCWEALHWLFSARRATVALLEATAPAWAKASLWLGILHWMTPTSQWSGGLHKTIRDVLCAIALGNFESFASRFIAENCIERAIENKS